MSAEGLTQFLACVLQAQLREWEAAEAHKKQLAREVALKLKEDRAAQLADKDLVRDLQESAAARQNSTANGHA